MWKGRTNVDKVLTFFFFYKLFCSILLRVNTLEGFNHLPRSQALLLHLYIRSMETTVSQSSRVGLGGLLKSSYCMISVN